MLCEGERVLSQLYRPLFKIIPSSCSWRSPNRFSHTKFSSLTFLYALLNHWPKIWNATSQYFRPHYLKRFDRLYSLVPTLGLRQLCVDLLKPISHTFSSLFLRFFFVLKLHYSKFEPLKWATKQEIVYQFFSTSIHLKAFSYTAEYSLSCTTLFSK